MDELIVQGEIREKILHLRGEHVPSTGSGTNYMGHNIFQLYQSVNTEDCRSEVTEYDRSEVAEFRVWSK